MYRTICAELWTDPAIKSLDVSTKLLFVYLITNPHTHLCGIYYLPEEIGMRETGLKKIPYQYGIDTLSKLNKAYWDAQTETIFVVNMFQYQGRGSKNYIAASNHLETLHNSVLIPRFLSRYPEIPYRYPIDTLSNISPSVPDPDPDPDPDPVLSDSSERSSKKKENGKHPFPEAFTPSEKHKRLAEEWQLDVGFQFGKFKNYCLSHDKRYSNYEATFRNWLAEAYERSQRHDLR